MPYESLRCPKCGSGDCQEVKPGTHFCNYCDNVFKYVSPAATGGGVAACATCGVVAVGLCLTCNRHFCRGHQAVEPPTRYIDCCAACLKERDSRRRAERARQWEQEQRRSRQCGRIYLEESARSELTAARVPLVELCFIGQRAVKRRFGGERMIEDYNWGRVGSGWLLGDFAWEVTSGSRNQTVFFAECAGLPRLHYSPIAFSSLSHRDVKSVMFGRVTGKTADGRYGVALDPGKLRTPDEELGAAVQRLAGTTTQHR
jgi:hypothetical protein